MWECTRTNTFCGLGCSSQRKTGIIITRHLFCLIILDCKIWFIVAKKSINYFWMNDLGILLLFGWIQWLISMLQIPFPSHPEVGHQKIGKKLREYFIVMTYNKERKDDYQITSYAWICLSVLVVCISILSTFSVKALLCLIFLAFLISR